VDAEGVDQLGRHGSQRQVPEDRDEDLVDHAAVVAHRGRAALAVVLDVAQPLGRRVGEGDVVGAPAGDRPGLARLDEDLVEQLLRALLGQIPLPRPPPTLPACPETCRVRERSERAIRAPARSGRVTRQLQDRSYARRSSRIVAVCTRRS
jgi:hypothetical protein